MALTGAPLASLRPMKKTKRFGCAVKEGNVKLRDLISYFLRRGCHVGLCRYGRFFERRAPTLRVVFLQFLAKNKTLLCLYRVCW